MAQNVKQKNGTVMKDYEIITNKNGRRILVIYSPVYVEKCTDISYPDFDAIFVDVADVAYETNRLAIWKSSPIMILKCWLKPQFVSSRLKDNIRMTRHIVDGYASSPLDESFTSAIEDIWHYIRELGISTDAMAIKTGNDFFIRLCQFALTRRISTFTTGALNGFASGYTLINAALFEYQETIYKKERLLFNQSLLEMGYIRPVRFVEKIHLCPQCKHSHLYFAEACPSCMSTNIVMESVIHHFRCANVSPESEYMYDGELRCPKCKHYLRHIGVDYDRPASTYHCKECGKQFLHSKIKVTCSNCNKVTPPSELLAQDIMEYAFTQEGIQALVSGHIFMAMEREVFAGYVDFDLFLNSLSVSLYSSTVNDEVYSIVRIIVDGDVNMKKRLRPILSRMPTAKVTVERNRFYALMISERKDCDKDLSSMVGVLEAELAPEDCSYKVDRYVLESLADVKTFIKEQRKGESVYIDG